MASIPGRKIWVRGIFCLLENGVHSGEEIFEEYFSLARERRPCRGGNFEGILRLLEKGVRSREGNVLRSIFRLLEDGVHSGEVNFLRAPPHISQENFRQISIFPRMSPSPALGN